jgi:DOPA 4,5-dioxygenase
MQAATRLTEEDARRFDVKLGRLHQKPVGPHPQWSRQIDFEARTYPDLIEWLDAHRQGLTILVHGDTGDDLVDHTTHAWWLGEPDTLDPRMFRNRQ